MITDDNTHSPIVFKATPDNENPSVHHILQYDDTAGDYRVVGDYTVIDDGEPADITAKKVLNLVALLNKQDPTVDFSSLTNERVLFSMNRNNDSDTHQTIVFRTIKGDAMSKENAILTIKNDAIAHMRG